MSLLVQVQLALHVLVGAPPGPLKCSLAVSKEWWGTVAKFMVSEVTHTSFKSSLCYTLLCDLEIT